jgi:hypothetical protein
VKLSRTGTEPPGPSTLGEAAASFLGCRFRLHGRDPATGLDCVGLVCASLAAIGRQPVAPAGYGLRNLSIDHWLAFADLSGLEPASGPAASDEVLLINLGYGQHHLLISLGHDEVVHAHAGLGRVVRHRRETTCRIHARWRLRPAKRG